MVIQVITQSMNCSKCGSKMNEVPVGDHTDFMCPVCGSSAPVYCTKRNVWR